MGKSDLPEEDFVGSNNLSDSAGEGALKIETTVTPIKGTSSASVFAQEQLASSSQQQYASAATREDESEPDSLQPNIFNRKVLPYANYDFSSPSTVYKVRRRNGTSKEHALSHTDIYSILGEGDNDTDIMIQRGSDTMSDNSDVRSGDESSSKNDTDESNNVSMYPSSSPEQIISNMQPTLVDIMISQETPTVAPSPSSSLKPVVKSKAKKKKKKRNKKEGVVTTSLPPRESQGSSSPPPASIKSSPSSSPSPVNLEKTAAKQNVTKPTLRVRPLPSSPQPTVTKKLAQVIAKKKLKEKTNRKKMSSNKTISTKHIMLRYKPRRKNRKRVHTNSSNDDVGEYDRRNNSGSGNNSNDSSSSNEHPKLRKTHKRQMAKNQVKKLHQQQHRHKKIPLHQRRKEPPQKRKQSKPHLHKQSSESESTEAKKRPAIPAANAIYPVYGQRFPLSYYHTKHPTTPAPTKSPSFFSYFFGR